MCNIYTPACCWSSFGTPSQDDRAFMLTIALWCEMFLLWWCKKQMRAGRICSDLKWIPVGQEGIEARSHLLRLLLWTLKSANGSCKDAGVSLRLPKEHLHRLPGRKSWNLVCCTLDITFSSSVQFYLMVAGKSCRFRFFFFLTIVDISTRNGVGFSFRFNRKYMLPVSISLLWACCPRHQIKYL